MAPQKKAASTASRVKLFYGVLALVALAGLGALAMALSGVGSGGAATELVALEGVDDPQALVGRAEGVLVGDPAAPVKIIEFGDYQCAACGRFAQAVKPLLDLNYVQTGKVQFVFYDFPLVEMHPTAFLAARAARCAGDQDQYWLYHDALFARQPQWASSGDAVDDFVGYAAELGLDEAAFESCLRSDRHAATVTANRRLGEQLGVNATPTVIMAGRRVRNPLDYEAISALIDQEFGG